MEKTSFEDYGKEFGNLVRKFIRREISWNTMMFQNAENFMILLAELTGRNVEITREVYQLPALISAKQYFENIHPLRTFFVLFTPSEWRDIAKIFVRACRESARYGALRSANRWTYDFTK